MVVRNVVMVGVGVGVLVVGLLALYVLIVVKGAVFGVAILQLSVLNGLSFYCFPVVAVYRPTEVVERSLASLQTTLRAIYRVMLYTLRRSVTFSFVV